MPIDGRQQPATPQQWLPDVPFDLPEAAQNLIADMKAKLEALYIDPTPPGPPTGVTVAAATSGNIVRWAPTVKAAGYRVYRNTTNSFATATLVHELQGLNNVSWYDPFDVATGATLYYWIVSINATGVASTPSTMVSITP